MLRQLGDLIRQQHYVQSFAAIRFLAGLVGGVGLIGAFLSDGRPADLRWFFPILSIFTIANIMAVWQSSRRRIDRWLVPLSLLDTALIGALILATGGIASPLELLYLFPIGQVAIGASVRSALIVAGVAMATYTAGVFSPFGAIDLSQRSGLVLSHLEAFNVVVSDVLFFAFAVAAGQAGQALRSQEDRLLNRGSRLRREVGTLARLARTTARETELAPILGMVMETATLELGLTRSAVILRGNADAELHVVSARGFGASDAGGPTVPVSVAGGVLVDTVVTQRRTLTAQRRYRRHRSGGAVYEEQTPGAAAAPLLVGDACLGCLYVDAGPNQFHWSDESLLLLEAFADLTAVSVDNTRLYSGLVAEKSKLEATMGAVTDALLIYEPGGQVLLANAPFRALFDVSPQATAMSVVGLSAYIREQQRLGFTDGFQEATDLFETTPAELEVGSPARQLQRRGKVVRDDAGQAVATVLTFHDVTEEHQAERVRSEILATVSHELRTPLTSIKGFVQIFDRRQRRGDAAAGEHELHLVLNQVEHLMALVDDLLDVSHLPGRHMRLVRTTVDLAALCRQRIERVMMETGRQVALRCTARNVCGQWDAKKLAQVLDNLLDNAVKYSEPASAVNVRLYNTPGRLTVAVNDLGVGVVAEHLEDVFEAFFRVDNTTTRRTNGLGIGLYLCKRIIEQHGGEMAVSSRPGVGSEFGFSLPLTGVETPPYQLSSGLHAGAIDRRDHAAQ
ncbi:MAG: ATP-binding protein [Chloroflexota bacterium]